VKADVVMLRRTANGQRPGRRAESDEARLWHIGTALALGFAAAVLGLAALAWLAWILLRRPKIPHPGTLSLHDTVSVVQLVFASVAGAGALVALIVAYRRQKIAEADSTHDRTRVYNERFTTVAAQLGDDKPAVRLAGVHALAGLADDWKANRQTCIDVLCAYLRLPYEPYPGDEAPGPELLAFQASREVRHTIIRVITAHLKDGAAVSWQGLNFDFTGVVFDGGSFIKARFSGGTVDFSFAKFSGGTVDFSVAEFWGGTVDFTRATFSGGMVDFGGAEFSDGTVDFGFAKFSGGMVNFSFAEFSGGKVLLDSAKFTDGTVFFTSAKFYGGAVRFTMAVFSGGMVLLGSAKFSAGVVNFNLAQFSGSLVEFAGAEFNGGIADFSGAKFSGGTVDLSDTSDWSHPPKFDWAYPPPDTHVKFPRTERKPT
jgi:uncharacterized protein YjbI with pentapeptide repeats